MDVGSELRQAREQRGLSLQQLSRITKISPRVLQAIEASDEDRLPAPVFARSFVRTYAAEVHLDPDATMRRYFEQLAPPAAAEPAPTPVAARTTPPYEVFLAWVSRAIRRPTPVEAVLVAAGLAAIVLTRTYTHATRPATPSAAAVVMAAPAATAPAPSVPPTVATSGTSAMASDAVQLTIAPTGPCWVRATAGGEAVFAGLLDKGDRREITGRGGITLRVGDPAACGFAIEGRPARVPGQAGRPVTVRITRENYQQFLTR